MSKGINTILGKNLILRRGGTPSFQEILLCDNRQKDTPDCFYSTWSEMQMKTIAKVNRAQRGGWGGVFHDPLTLC